MKILTNIRFAQTAGIAQVILSFIDFIENSKGEALKVAGVNIINQNKQTFKKTSGRKTSALSFGIDVPAIGEVIKKAKSIKDVEEAYEKVINVYQKAIKKEKPELVLINGTYFLPWCLLLASQRENIPAVLHYHGILTKETQNWAPKERNIFLDMERCFDKKDIFYIFPSKMTKTIVEKEVFGHKIKKSAIIPNPISDHFFAQKQKIDNKNIGIVSRWAGIKNVKFCEELARYNHKKGGKFIVNIITDLDKNDKKYKKLAKFVNFHQPRTNKKLVSFYRNMGVIISPSHFETYGNVAKEALASGTPAMVNPNMGVSETYKNLGLDDWIIEFDSVENVYGKIEDAMGQVVTSKVRDKIKKLYPTQKIFKEIATILSVAT